MVTKFQEALASHGVRCLHSWASGSSTIDQRAFSPWTLNKRLSTNVFRDHPSLEKIPIHWTPLATKGSSPGTPSATIQRYVHDQFATIVGGLIYLVVSCRPDLAQAVGVLARYMHGPTPEAVVGCIHCCGYIKNPPVQRMKLEYCVKDNRVRSHIAKQHGDRSAAIHIYSGPLHGVDDIPLSVYSDATLSGPVGQQCKATSGLVIFHLFHLIDWMTKLQPFTVALSHNAELLALALAADEAMWIRKTITELWFCYPEFISPDHTHPPAICDVSENEGIVDGINHFDIALADGSVMRADLVQQSIAQHSKTNNAPWYDSWSWNNIFKSTTMMIDNLGVQFSAQNPDTNKTRIKTLGHASVQDPRLRQSEVPTHHARRHSMQHRGHVHEVSAKTTILEIHLPLHGLSR